MKSRSVLAFLLIMTVLFAGCTDTKIKTNDDKSDLTPPQIVAVKIDGSTLISESEFIALEKELTEMEDIMLEIESVDIDITELDETFLF